MIISISGKKRSGKDTVADMLTKAFGYKKVSFADKLKEVVALGMNIPIEDFYSDKKDEILKTPLIINEEKTLDLLDELLKIKEYIDNYTHLKLLMVNKEFTSIRSLLQWFGTEIGRNQIDKNIWVESTLDEIYPHELTVIADVRFKTERDAIKDVCGISILVKREVLDESDSHISENDLGDDSEYDVVINNNSSISKLHDEVMQWHNLKFKHIMRL